MKTVTLCSTAVACLSLLLGCGPGPGPSTPTGAVPAAPSALVASATSSTAIHISWADNSDDETGFELERSPDASTWTQIATPAANAVSYDDTGLSPSTTYYYRIRATNPAGDSAYSNNTLATTRPPAGTVPAAPSSLVASATSSTAIHLTWTDNANDETGFKLERSPNGSTWTQLATPAVNATSYDDSGLSASTTYYYRIRATNSAGDSAYSNTANAATNAPAICVAGTTKCVAGNVSVVQTCNGSGAAWVQSSCQGWQACTDGACRNLCGLTGDPTVPTVCYSPSNDGVNNETIYYYNDTTMAQKYTAGGALASIVLHDTSLTWPYYWDFNGVYSTGMAYVEFTANQFGRTVSATLSARARRAGSAGTTGYTDRFTAAAWSNNAGTQLYGNVIGSALYTWSPLNLTVSSGWSYGAGVINEMAFSMTGDGYGDPVDNMDVNWVMLQVR